MAEVQQSLLKRIYEQLIQGNHNDVQLVFEDGSTTGSKICLTALSPYFEAMLTSEMLEKKTGVITLPTISSTTFQNIIKLYFLGEDVVNELNCFPLLEAAEMMQLDHMKSLCLDYLNNNLSPTTDNCVDMWRSLKKFCFEDLATKAFQYLVKNVERLSESGSILSLTKSEYIELLSRDDLPQKEDDVLRDLQTWIMTNNPSAETMVDLFKVVRFEHVSLAYLHHDVIFTSIVKENEALQATVQEGLTKHSQTYGEICTFIDNRISAQILDVVFVLKNSHNLLSAACLTDNTWYELPPAAYAPGYWFAAAVFGKCIYITGGEKRQESTMLYDVWKKGWTFGPKLTHNRCEHCMAAASDKLYVIGGRFSNTIEELNQEQTDWKVVGDLGCIRRDSCAEAVGVNILVMGGTVSNLPSDHLHCFNTSTHAVCKIKTQKQSGILTRSFPEIPNLYLVHVDGSVDVVHIEESTTPTLTIERVAKHDEYGLWFGFVYKDGNIIVITSSDIQKVNIRDCSKESITFQNSLNFDKVHRTLNMHVPRVCLQ